MHIGIVIPSHNLADKLDRCLEHILASNLKHEMSVVVIDNSSDDDSVLDVVKKRGYWQDGYYVRLPWNFPFARASNTGIHVLGQVDAFLFLNNDCYVDPDCVEAMASALTKGRGSIIGARLRYPDGTIQHAGIEIVGNWRAISHMHRGADNEAVEVKKSRQVSCVTGACMLVHAMTFVRLGGFLEIFENSYEDIDFCLRAREQGKMTYYCAEATAIHEEGQTPGRKDKETENATLFFNKYSTRDVRDYKI